jgi:hypothetical protein
MNEQLADALGYVLTGFCTAVTPLLVGLLVQTIRYLGSLAKIRLTAADEQQIRFAAEHGVAAAAGALRDKLNAGREKRILAIQTAASLTPAFDKLPSHQQTSIIEATYAKLRPSLQTPSQPPPMASLVPGQFLSIPVQIISSVPPPAPPDDEPTTTLPAPAKTPVFTRAGPPATTTPLPPLRRKPVP